MKTTIQIINKDLNISKVIVGEFSAAIWALNKLIWANPINDIERSDLTINGESLPLNVTPFHYCFAKGRIDEYQLLDFLRDCD